MTQTCVNAYMNSGSVNYLTRAEVLSSVLNHTRSTNLGPAQMRCSKNPILGPSLAETFFQISNHNKCFIFFRHIIVTLSPWTSPLLLPMVTGAKDRRKRQLFHRSFSFLLKHQVNKDLPENNFESLAEFVCVCA